MQRPSAPNLLGCGVLIKLLCVQWAALQHVAAPRVVVSVVACVLLGLLVLGAGAYHATLEPVHFGDDFSRRSAIGTHFPKHRMPSPATRGTAGPAPPILYPALPRGLHPDRVLLHLPSVPEASHLSVTCST